MKHIFTVLLILIIAAVVYAASVSNYREQGGERWVIGGSLDVISGGDLDIESGGALKLDGTAITATAAEMNILAGASDGFGSLLLDPTDVVPAATEGRFYYSDADNALKLRTDTAWVDIDISGASSLATAYTAGSKILAPTLEVEIEVADTSDNPALRLDFDDVTTNAQDVFVIDNAGDDAAACSIQINGTAGYDIQGTSDTWNVSYLGVGTYVGLVVGATDIVLENGGKIENSTDTEILIAENSEDFIWDFTTNGVTIKSSTGVVAVNWGDVDSFTGLNALAFDGAVANTITQTGTGATDDLTISQATSGQDASLILQSSGTGADALSLISSVADISLSSADNITRTAADNITDTTTDGGYTVTVGGGTNGDYSMTAADNASMVAVGTFTIQNTEAASDITINSVLGSIYIEAEEDAANAILLTADGGTASTMKLHNDTGTSVTEGASSIQLLSDAGGIELKSTANLANAINVMVDGGTTSKIMIFNDTGTSITENAASIDIWSDVGGIEIQSDADLDDAIVLRVDGGTASEMTFHNDQGVTADSIELLSDAGGITIDCALALKLEAGLCLNDISTIGQDDATPDVHGDSFFATGTNADTIDDFDGTGIEEGQIIVVISKAAITYDTDGGLLKAGTTDLVTASGDVTQWIYDGTDWYLLSWIDNAADQNGKG